MKSLTLAATALLAAALTAGAQVAHPPEHVAQPQGAPAPVDSASFARARQMVLEGSGVAGRALVDSLLGAAPVGSPNYVEALYWRAALASTAADAERDYRRIIVEHGFAARAADALLAIAQLEMSRGDRAGASSHLQRFLAEYPERADRTRAGLWLGRLQVEQGSVARGCATLATARAALTDAQAELRNQIDFQMQRCAGIDTTAARTAESAPAPAAPAPAPAPTPAPTAPTGATASATSAPAKAPAAGRAPAPAKVTRAVAEANAKWTVQVAAYRTREEADAVAQRMRGRGDDAYVVVAAGHVFRVRVGHLASRDEAIALLRALRARGSDGFVTTIAPESTR